MNWQPRGIRSIRPVSGLAVILPALLATLAVAHFSIRAQTTAASTEAAIRLSGTTGSPVTAPEFPGPIESGGSQEPVFGALKAIYR